MKCYQCVSCFRKEFDTVKESILIIVQDMWSAIRNTCVSKLSMYILPLLSLTQLQALYTDLLAVRNATYMYL